MPPSNKTLCNILLLIEFPPFSLMPPRMVEEIYTVSHKTRHQTLANNFTKYKPIFKLFSLIDSVVNLQQTRV